MKITIVVGSHRQNSQSQRVADYLARLLQAQNIEVAEIVLSEIDLPLWNEDVWNKTAVWEGRLKPIREQLQKSQALIVITPEYSGMASPILKNFFLFLSKKEVGHKPALVVAVSSGRGGAYPVSELRSSSYKNCGICYIPEHLIFRNVEKLKLDDQFNSEYNEEENFMAERSKYALRVLIAYAEALQTVRVKDGVFSEKFVNGM